MEVQRAAEAASSVDLEQTARSAPEKVSDTLDASGGSDRRMEDDSPAWEGELQDAGEAHA